MITDLKILQTIYTKYYSEFKNMKTNKTKFYIPIDCKEIAKELNIDGDIIFGRLYYHMDKKYSYTQDDGSKVHFFTMNIENNKKHINFLLLDAVLADMKESRNRYLYPFGISIIALVMSFFSIVVS